jgi:CRISPR/Cas system-associated endoribonuclease Cas2
LRRVARVCQDYGQRVQKSVFECKVDKTTNELLEKRLLDEINGQEDNCVYTDSVSRWQNTSRNLDCSALWTSKAHWLYSANLQWVRNSPEVRGFANVLFYNIKCTCLKHRDPSMNTEGPMFAHAASINSGKERLVIMLYRPLI